MSDQLLPLCYQAPSMSSMVMSVDHPGLTFNLTLMRSEPTYNQPVQQWTFTSDFAVSVNAHTKTSAFVRLCAQLPFERPPLLLRSGEGLLWHLHSEADPLYDSPEYGIRHSAYLQSQRTGHLQLRHQIPAGKATFCLTLKIQ